MIKSIMLLVRKPGLSHEAFVEHWTGEHARLAREVPQLLRYVQSALPADDPSGVDGVAELCFADEASRDAFRASEAGRRWIADGANFLDGAQCRQFQVGENRVVG